MKILVARRIILIFILLYILNFLLKKLDESTQEEDDPVGNTSHHSRYNHTNNSVKLEAVVVLSLFKYEFIIAF